MSALPTPRCSIYQPQVNKWDGNQIDFRSALAIKPTGATAESFGVVFATARTQVDKITRMVVFENLKHHQDGLSDAARSRNAVHRRVAETLRLGRANDFAGSAAGLARAGGRQGADRRGAEHAAAGAGELHAGDPGADRRCARAAGGAGPSACAARRQHPCADPPGRLRRQLLHPRLRRLASIELHHRSVDTGDARTVDGERDERHRPGALEKGVVDLLDGGPKANPKPSLANGVPAIYTSQVPTELVVFSGQPDFVPIVGTQLLWAANTTSDVLVDIVTGDYYVLLAGRWFRGPGLAGPWTFVAGNALPPDFARIPPHSLAGAVLPTVAGTPQAQEAVIENSIPQTATVPLEERPEVHAELRRRAAILADPRHPAVLRDQHVGAHHPGLAVRLLRGRGRRLVQRAGVDRAVDDRHLGAGGDLHDSPVVAGLLRHLRAHLRGHSAGRLRGLHAGLPRHLSSPPLARSSTAPGTPIRRGSDRSGTHRPTPTASQRRRSTTRTSATRSASRSGSPPRHGRRPTGAAPTTPPDTGAATTATRAARPRVPT